MYFLEGVKLNLENLVILSKSAQHNISIKSSLELKHAYNTYLAQFQPEVTLSESVSPELVKDEEDRQRLIALFMQKSRVNDLSQEKVISLTWFKDRRNSCAKIERALEDIHFKDERLGELLNLVINKIFLGISDLAGGGSSSGAIGCIWLNPKPTWTHQDFCEFLIHEFTHQLLFLDERRWGHYPDPEEIEKPEHFARSAILNRERPLDKVIHSLVVAYEVLRFRERHFGLSHKTQLHPDAAYIQQSIDLTIHSLRSVPRHLLSERVWDLIEMVKKNGRFRSAV